MNDNSPAPVRLPFAVFFWTFAVVFALVLGFSILDTLLLPYAYVGATDIEVKYKPAEGQQAGMARRTYDAVLTKTESIIIGSDAVLRKAVWDLNLNEIWGRKYFNDETLKTFESLKILKGRLAVFQIPGTTLIRICVYDEQPDDAATDANGIAKAYMDFTATNNEEVQVQVIDPAYANKTPVKPNKPLNYFFGVLAGIFWGLLAAAGVALIVYLLRRGASNPPKLNAPQAPISNPRY